MLSIDKLEIKHKNFHCDLSIIIPARGFSNSLNQTLISVLEQSLLPKEIIIVDSSHDNINNDVIKKHFNLSFIKYFKVKSLYPGEARNYGAEKAISKFLAFLDSKTKPISKWIEDYFKIINEKKINIIFGTTKYIAKNSLEKKIIAASYGFKFIETTPGSIIKKDIFFDQNRFIENVRTADDLEWRNNLKNKNYIIFTPNSFYLIYSDVPKSLFQNFYRYFIYSFHTARVDVQTKTKTLYLCLFLIFTAIIIPKWNWLLPNWDNNPLYIPNITKIYFLSVICFFLLYVVINNLIFKKLVPKLINQTIKVVILILLFYFIYRYKIIIANSVESIVNIIPHTIQYYLLVLVILSLIVRGIFLPLLRGVSFSYLFPINFISIMFYGLMIDIAKTPGYLIGAIFQIFKFTKKNDTKSKTIVIFTKYSTLSASVRYRFLIYKDFLETKGYLVKFSYMFDDVIYKEKIFNNKILFFKIIKSYLIRLYNLLFLNSKSIVIIHLELTPFLFSLGEKILYFKKIPFIIDLDDAIYFRNENFQKKFNSSSNYDKSFDFSLKQCSKIFAGNKTIFEFVKKYNNNVSMIPTIVNTKNIENKISHIKNSKFTIVWIGSPSTSVYLHQIIKILKKIDKNNIFKLRLIGAKKFQVTDIECEFLEWSEETEFKLISESHIGVMPLPDTIWSRSKCGFKLIQYMACELPVIASPVGVNIDIVKDGINGFLCSTEKEWESKINYFIKNPDIIKQMGVNAKKQIIKHYDLEVWKKKFIEELKA